MKNANTKRNKINIIFSSFLVIGYIVCTYFFSTLAGQLSGTIGSLVQILMLVVFGLLLFYATRVGEGKQVRRFSLAVLLLIDLPALYIILASLITALPFHNAIATQSAMAMMGIGGLTAPSIILTMACIALGYGIPYTFFSGYEMKEEDEVEAAEEAAVVEGGLAEELAQTDDENEEKAEAPAEEVQETAEEAVEETAEETVEETAEEKEEKKEEEA